MASKDKVELQSIKSEKPFNKALNSQYKNNKIKTSKYTWLTFLPLNLFNQFHKAANIYFVIICFGQVINRISVSEGRPTNAPGLGIVLLVSMFKDFFEDWKRKANDEKENNHPS